MTSATIINIALELVVLASILGLIAWGIATQRRDAAVTLARRARRRVVVRQRPGYEGARRGQAWPA